MFIISAIYSILQPVGSGYITISAASLILGISTETLRKWDQNKLLKAKRGENGYRLYKISDLEKFAKKMGLRRPSMKRKLVK